MTSQTLPEFGPLSLAEEKLLASLDSGAFDRVGVSGAPIVGDATRAIRASLLRYLHMQRKIIGVLAAAVTCVGWGGGFRGGGIGVARIGGSGWRY
jgi:hypothetical protein